MKCADKKSAEFLDAEEKVKAAIQVAKEESAGDTTQAKVRASVKLTSMGVEEDTITGLTAIDAADDGTLDSSLCEATAQVMYAALSKDDDRDDDAESVCSGSSSSTAVAAAAVPITLGPLEVDTYGWGLWRWTSKNTEQKLRTIPNS